MTEQLEELRAIKKLLILLLLKNKVGQEEIAKTLGVDQSSVSRMVTPRNKPQIRGEQTAEESQDS